MARYRGILRAAAALALLLPAVWRADAQDMLIIDSGGARWQSGDSGRPSVTIDFGVIESLPADRRRGAAHRRDRRFLTLSIPQPETPFAPALRARAGAAAPPPPPPAAERPEPQFAARRPEPRAAPAPEQAAGAGKPEARATAAAAAASKPAGKPPPPALPARPAPRPPAGEAAPPLRAFLDRAAGSRPAASAPAKLPPAPRPIPPRPPAGEAAPPEEPAARFRLPPPPPETGAPALATRAAPVGTFFYPAGEAALGAEDRARLGSLAARLAAATGFDIEIRAYSGPGGGAEARRRAWSRAMEVRSLLLAGGVAESRIRALAASAGGEAGARVDIVPVGRS